MTLSYKIAALLFMVGFTLQANAQGNGKTTAAAATATATATIIDPDDIIRIEDMHIDPIVAKNAKGTNRLDAGVPGKADRLQKWATSGTVNTASFTARGEAGYAYSITLPEDVHRMKTGIGLKGEVMTISNWSTNATGILIGGAEKINIGTTWTLEATHVSGIYPIEKPFTVRVNYN